MLASRAGAELLSRNGRANQEKSLSAVLDWLRVLSRRSSLCEFKLATSAPDGERESRTISRVWVFLDHLNWENHNESKETSAIR